MSNKEKVKKSLDDYMEEFLTKGEKIIGGKADGAKDSEFDKKQLKDGVKVEKEHTKDKKIAKEIARDHLKEIPDYYSRLDKMEKKAKKEGVKKSFEDRVNNLSKAAFVNKDTNTYTDSNSVALAKISTPEEYNSYIEGFVKDVEPGVSVDIPLQNNKSLHIYKVENGLFSGHIKESDGTISHNISEVTIPEIVTQLVVKNAEPPVVVEEKKEEKSSAPVIININISKSKESAMDTLDEKINKLYKAEDQDPQPDQTNPDEQGGEGEDPTKQDEVHPAKASLITDIIKLLQEHHIQSNDENVKDLAKFIVHLHKDTGADDQDQLEQQMSQQPAPKAKPQAQPAPVMKKSISGMIDELKKCGTQVKRTKEENKLIFDKALQEMIENEYYYMKRAGKVTADKMIETLKKKVKERVIDRMSYNDSFLLAQRDSKFDDKYLADAIKKVDLEEIDTRVAEQNAKQPELMYYSMEGRQVFGEGQGKSASILETLEKGNNFFGREITKPVIGGSFKEFDYENLSKGKIEKHTDALIKSRVDGNIRK